MILIDANLLIYSSNVAVPEHAAAKVWLEKQLSGAESVGLAWVTVLAFLRITTHKKIFPRPLERPKAAGIVTKWLNQPCVEIVEPGEGHWPILRDLIEAHGIGGPLVMDAHLAALAMENDATLYTSDKDFQKFEGLRWVNPLKKD